ncbi:MAG TPA: adenine deaminase C-terminal domain-containing protein, partial [Mobilitalea sp.]|nr:adenine deaminase C-terminal domain-containing protein [Mobilitalea sp.]
IIKLAVVERHANTGHIGLSYMKGYGLKKGAIASSVSHDSHNVIVAGTNEADMCLAVNTISSMQGGIAVVCDGKVLDKLPLPIAGLMSELNVTCLAEKIDRLKTMARELGVPDDIDPFMTLAFISLPVIPKLKLSTLGLVDTVRQEIVEIFI